ncbi:TolC family protein [Brumimicrobium aurantiacum]|uniref:TolC family protein n=1 Tax=Brumimicrobium aurantiacum TaxID=1737063 RepID=A0A3E1EVF6_9FLAO|nr:TolC family protein [Brumimicrobium aurantiacum]RFC53539.1 TolC family protein [Brumimicrobium aurantiacum]
MNRLKKLMIAVVLLITQSAISQEFSLFEAQTFALENAEQIQRSELDLETAKKQVVETRATGLPQINSETTFQQFLNLPTQVVDGALMGQPGTTVEFTAGQEFNTNAGISANQLIFNGSYIVALQVSKFYTEFVATNIKKSEQDVLSNVTQAYQMALISKRNKQFVDTLVEVTENLINKQKELFEVGFITQEEVDQTEFSLLSTKANLTAAETAYENALLMLKMTMAYPLNKEITLTEDLDKMLLTQEKDISGSYQNNLELDILKKQRQISEYDLKNVKMSNYPQLSAFFNHQYQAYRNEFNFFNPDERWYNQTVWGIKLTIPIFAGGERWAKIQKAKIKVKQDELNIQEFERSLSMQETQLRNELNSARINLQLQKKNVELASKIHDNSMIKAEIGKENSIVVTQKYNQLVQAQSNYVNAMVEVFNKKLELDKLYNKLIRK